MQTQGTTEEALQVLNDDICAVAVKADIERKLFIKAGYHKAAVSLGSMMVLIWKLFRSCKVLHEENVKLREESMEMKRVNRATAAMKFDPVAKAHLN